MPVGSFGKWLMLGTLVAAIGATGCKEDDGESPPADTGVPDSGGGPVDAGVADTGPKDSGSPADTGPTDSAVPDANVMCGTLTCTPHVIMLTGAVVAAGCSVSALDAAVCGISTSTLGGVDAGLPAFVEKAAPGIESAECGKFIDNLEATPDGGLVDGGAKGNGKVDVTTGGFPISYPGCCNEAGFCSADTNKGKLGGSTDVAGGYGCLTPAIFLARFITTPADRFVRCSPTDGKLIDAGTSSDAGGDAGPTDAGADGGNG